MNLEDFIGKMTEKQSVEAFTLLLDHVPEPDALRIIREWIERNHLEGELE